MALAHADDRRDLPVAADVLSAGPAREARGGRPGFVAPPAPFPAERIRERAADAALEEDDDRAAAFAPIPLFRESDPETDMANAFVPILELRGSEPRPLPWETVAAPDDEFIVDPAVVAERLEDLPPPIPFSRNQPRG